MSIKRSLQAVFLNTTPNAEKPNYNRVGHGVTDMSISYNPQTTTEQDVTQDTAETEVTGYQPNIPASQKAKKGDPVFDFVNELRRKRATFDDCKTDIVIVDLYDGNPEKGYAAEKQVVAVQVDEYGGAGSDPLALGYTINFCGDSVEGTFDPKTKTFVEKTDDVPSEESNGSENGNGDEENKD